MPDPNHPPLRRAPVLHQERLAPSAWLYLAALGLAASFGLVASPFGQGWAVGTTAVVLVAVLAGLWRSTPTVRVDSETFVAGRARIPVILLDHPQALDAQQMRVARGPRLDARAYLCLRGWIPGGVSVPLIDPDDDTPYWLVSSRRPVELAGALTEAVDAARRRLAP